VRMTACPPIMIKFTLMSFEKMGFAPEQTFTTLEKRMKCGIGICGRCNVGPKYVCGRAGVLDGGVEPAAG
jgi:sulfhydrogenase subunit gamma (sulfur reductase)